MAIFVNSKWKLSVGRATNNFCEGENRQAKEKFSVNVSGENMVL
jgi:hypothetical protein